MKPRKIINEGEILMKNIKRNLLICLLVVFCSVALAGCNNKVKDELAAANDKIAELEKQLEEAKEITHLPDFKGYIHDVGGPTANFRGPACNKQVTKGACKNRQCLDPSPCKNLKVDHTDYIELLRKVRNVPGVKKVFVRSGIRYDYVMADKDNKFLRELIKHHVSGQLKVAPEHVAEEVLHYMQKPAGETYEKFRQKYFDIKSPASWRTSVFSFRYLPAKQILKSCFFGQNHRF